MLLTYYGHSCFRLETGGRSILFDPFISPNELAKHIDVSTIKTDYVLLSHGHSDHIADLPQVMKANPDATLVASWEICEWAQKQGITTNVHPMNIGGSWAFDFGDLKMVFAAHSNSLPDGTYGGVAAGYVLFTEEGTLYFAGDTALTADMRMLADMDINVALLPIGSNFTMDFYDAATAADWINCKRIIGMHYDTFGYIKIDHQQARDNFERKGLELTLMGIGTSVSL